MPGHEWIGSMLRFQRENGEWGELVDLRGKQGPRGFGGGGGGGGFDPSGLAAASETPTPDQVIVYQSGEWVRASWTQFTGWIGIPVVETFRLLTESGDIIAAEYGSVLRTE